MLGILSTYESEESEKFGKVAAAGMYVCMYVCKH